MFLSRFALSQGCFWGTEKGFWRVPGVVSTSVGYTGGMTKNPTYEEVCSGMTGHNEVVRVVWDPLAVSFADILCVFARNPFPNAKLVMFKNTENKYVL